MMSLSHPFACAPTDCTTTTALTCTLGQDQNSPVPCNNGTIDLPTAANCQYSATDGSVQFVDFPTLVSCPNATEGTVGVKLRVASSQYPQGNNCGPVTTTVYIKNTVPTTCSNSPLTISCPKGQTSDDPLLCSQTGDPVNLTLAAQCSLIPSNATFLVSGTNVSCPPSGQTQGFLVYAEVSPNRGDTDTCGPKNTTIYLRNDRKWGPGGWTRRVLHLSAPQAMCCEEGGGDSLSTSAALTYP